MISNTWSNQNKLDGDSRWHKNINFAIDCSLQTRKENYSMDSLQKEYIKSIDFYYCEDDYVFCIFFNRCDIETNLNFYTVQIGSVESPCVESLGVYVLGQDFEPVDETFFVGAQLFRVVENVDGPKDPEDDSKFFKDVAKHYKWFKFETSKGDFYVQTSVWHDGNWLPEIDYHVEPIDEESCEDIIEPITNLSPLKPK